MKGPVSLVPRPEISPPSSSVPRTTERTNNHQPVNDQLERRSAWPIIPNGSQASTGGDGHACSTVTSDPGLGGPFREIIVSDARRKSLQIKKRRKAQRPSKHYKHFYFGWTFLPEVNGCAVPSIFPVSPAGGPLQLNTQWTLYFSSVISINRHCGHTSLYHRLSESVL